MKETSRNNTDSVAARKDRLFVVYYVFLSIVTVLMTRPHTEVGNIYRILYTLAFFIPTFIRSKWLPFAITVSFCVSMCSFSPLLPSKTYLLVAVAFAVILLKRQPLSKDVSPINVFFICYIFLIDLFYFDFQELVTYNILLMLCCSNCIKDMDDVKRLALAFVFISVILSALFLLNFETFLFKYSKEDDISRSGWINPNIFGGHLVTGFISAFWLLRGNTSKKMLSIALLICMGLTLIVLIMNASRGSIIAAVFPVVIMILFSRIKASYKFLAIIIGIIFIIFSFANGYYELLMYRMTDDTVSTGGLRTTIWRDKIDAFSQKGIVPLLFGVGQTKCELLAHNVKTHNDFLTALISYGVVGFFMFVIIFFRPLFTSKFFKSVEPSAFYSLLIIECTVLEPLFRGYFIFFMYFLFILKYLKFYSSGR